VIAGNSARSPAVSSCIQHAVLISLPRLIRLFNCTDKKTRIADNFVFRFLPCVIIACGETFYITNYCHRRGTYSRKDTSGVTATTNANTKLMRTFPVRIGKRSRIGYGFLAGVRARADIGQVAIHGACGRFIGRLRANVSRVASTSAIAGRTGPRKAKGLWPV